MNSVNTNVIKGYTRFQYIPKRFSPQTPKALYPPEYSVYFSLSPYISHLLPISPVFTLNIFFDISPAATLPRATHHEKDSNTALSPGETTDLPIPCGTAFPEGTEGLAIWVQIRLPKTILPQTEDYQCLRLDVAQAK